MFAIATLLTLVNSVSGTPYVSGGDSPAGTDCSGLVSWVTNAATGQPLYGNRFNTGNIESALLARVGFQYGAQPGALVVGWNGGHTAVTLPDGTPVSSGEGGGVKVGGGGAYQGQFTNHMFLPAPPEQPVPPAPVVLMGGPPPPPPAPPMPPPPAPPMAAPPAPAPLPPPPGDPFAPPSPAVPPAPVPPAPIPPA